MDPMNLTFLGVLRSGLSAAITQNVWRWIAGRLIDLISR